MSWLTCSRAVSSSKRFRLTRSRSLRIRPCKAIFSFPYSVVNMRGPPVPSKQSQEPEAFSREWHTGEPVSHLVITARQVRTVQQHQRLTGVYGLYRGPVVIRQL